MNFNGAINLIDAINLTNGNINFLVIHKGDTFPTTPSPVAGQLFYRTDENKLYIYTSSWVEVGSDANGGATGTRGTFDNSDLTSGILTITHNQGLSSPYTLNITISDNNNKMILPDDIEFKTNSIEIDLSSYGTISGTWGYYYI